VAGDLGSMKAPMTAVLQRRCGRVRAATGLVFTSSIGTPFDYSNLRKDFRALRKDANLPVIRLHDLRHTCATMLMVQGVPAKVVMETLGHSQISLTLDIYSHVSSELQGQAAEKMDELIRSAYWWSTLWSTRPPQ
jgi:integrase